LNITFIKINHNLSHEKGKNKRSHTRKKYITPLPKKIYINPLYNESKSPSPSTPPKTKTSPNLLF